MSWSGLKKWRQCPKLYWHVYESEDGPPEKESAHFTIMGSVVQATFEDFYEEKIWRVDNVVTELMKRAENHHAEYLKNNYVNFDDVTCQFDEKESLEDCLELIPKTLDAIKREKLWGSSARSEVPIEVGISGGSDSLRGKLDFVVSRSEKDEGKETVVVDGKSTKDRDRPDPDQLYFYALLYLLSEGELPDRLGFLFYRYADDPDKAFRWIDVDKYRIRSIRDEAFEAIEAIKASEERPATPEPKHCRWCPWEALCEPRQKQKEENKRRRMTEEDHRIDEVLSSDDDVVGLP